MANGFGCKCAERQKPIQDRQWVVTEYKWNHGAFVKDGGERSEYSTVVCLNCNHAGRTKAKYVEKLIHMNFFDTLPYRNQ